MELYTTYFKNKQNQFQTTINFILNYKKEQPNNYYEDTERVTNKTNNAPQTVKNIIEQNRKGINELNNTLTNFLTEYDFKNNKQRFYRKFSIPKRKGGMREIVEPIEELKYLQRLTLYFLQNNLRILTHNSAMAYERKRDAITNATRHKNSNYIITLDLKNFFPSISKEILKNGLLKISTLAEVNNDYPEFINNLIELAELDNGLPQGSPLSPFLSNLIMLPFDYIIEQQMRLETIPRYIYTRYADDLTFSATKKGDIKLLLNSIEVYLNDLFDGKIKLNKEKTKVLSTKGRCFVTGVKINQENKISYGHEKKTQLKHELYDLLVRAENKAKLSKEEVQHVLGKVAFLFRIEPEYTDYLTKKYLNRFNSQHKTLAKHFKEYL